MSRVKWVIPRKFAELTGYTEEAVIQAARDIYTHMVAAARQK